DLEHAALCQAQCVADGLGERDLAALGNGGFHGCPPMRGTVCMDYTYFQMHTFAHILAPRAGPPPEFPSGRRRLGPGEQRKRTAMPATTRSTAMADPFSTRSTLQAGGRSYLYASLPKLGERFDISRLPYSLKIVLENLLRHEDGVNVTAAHIEAVASWDPKAEPSTEIAFMPARVVLQDFTGVPCVVDLAAMRDAVVKLGDRKSTRLNSS